MKQWRKNDQKHVTKKVVEFNNQSTLSTTVKRTYRLTVLVELEIVSPPKTEVKVIFL